MKSKIILILFVFPLIAICQNNFLDRAVEIALRTSGFDNLDSVRFEIKSISPSYCKNFNLFYLDNGIITGNEYIMGNYQTGSDYGFDVCFSNDGWEHFGLALNKISIYVKNYGTQNWNLKKYFYIDYRDSNYGSIGNGSNDISFIYYKSNTIKYAPQLSYSYVQFYHGDILYWALISGPDSIKTDGLPNFWQNSLVIIKEDEEYPHLIWGKYPSFSNISGYYIYSGTPSNGIAPNDNNYQQIQQTSSAVYDYVDNSVGGINEIGGAPYIRLYFVKAKQGTQYSERSNIETVFSNVSWSNALVMVNEKNNIT